MKKNYIVPELLIVKVNAAHSILTISNSINGNSVILNPGSMDDGDGSDAVKLQGTYIQWDDWGSDE